MGGKSATTTQQVQIPPEVMARYKAVNTRAESAASQPFQAYSQDPSAFVAQLTDTQRAGIQNINQAAGMTQPYFDAAAGLTMGGAQGVGSLTPEQIQAYQNPYTQSVVNATMAGLQQQQGQQLSQQQAEAIKAGAFGGDRAGIQRAMLQGQQGLAAAQAISPLYQRAYEQAVQTATGQQGVRAQDLQRQLAAGQQLGGLTAQAQRSALEGAQAQLGAGRVEQETEQAGKSALYNQFLQERGYPFQVAQFLANIAMGTGALSGSTTTTTQPVPFASDERDKTNIQHLGKGLYAYDYKEDVRRAEEEGRPMPPKRVGPMAQDIEERAPGLVGEVGGHKVVKGLSPESMGGAVLDLGPGEYRENFAQGGGLAALYAQFGSPYGAQQGVTDGPYGGRAGYLKAGLSPPRDIAFKADTRQVKPISSIMQEASRGAEQASGFVNMFDPDKSPLAKGAQKGFGALQSAYQSATRPAGPTIDETSLTAQGITDPGRPYRLPGARAYGGLVGYAEGGEVEEDRSPVQAYDTPGAGLGIPTETNQPKSLDAAKPPSTQPKSVMSDLTDAAKVAASIFAMSDERMKSGMQQVGELYNGLPVYKYRMGDGPSQLGLSAQEAGGLHPEAVMQGDDGLLRLNYDRATRAYGGGLDPRQGYQAGGDPDPALVRSESGGQWDAQNDEVGAGGLRGHFGRVQFGQARLQDAMRAGVIPEGTTPRQFMDSRDLQRAAERWHFDDISNRIASQGLDRAIGTKIAGIPVTQQGLINVAHLGGSEGLRKFVESGGRYNPEDANGTRLTDYLKMGAAGPSAGLTAYAGQPQQGEGARNIDRVAGAPAGLGQAAGSTTPPTTTSREERGLLAGMLPVKFGTKTETTPEGKQFSGLGEFLTSRQFVQPLFEGLAGFASSPSLFAGPAILQGLGAASRSYSGLEKQMADMARSEAETEQVRERNSEVRQLQLRGDLFEGPTGPMVLMPGGKQIPMGEWIRQGRPPTLSQSRQPVIPGQTPAPGGERKDGAPGAGAGAAPSLPQPIVDLAKENFRYVSETNLAGLKGDEATNDPFTPTAQLANSVYGNRMQSRAFAKALSELPAGGPIQAELINPLKQRALDLLLMIGVPADKMPDLTRDVSSKDIIDKVRISMAQGARGGPAVEELNKVLAGIPSDLNSKEGQAQLVSSFLVDQQEAREKARMFNDYRRFIESQGINSAYSRHSGRGLNDAFEATMSARYQDDKKLLADMFRAEIKGRDGKPAPILDGKPATVMSYLIANSGRIPNKALEKKLIDAYGEENIRRAQQYFGG
jgi:hypothetical protein